MNSKSLSHRRWKCQYDIVFIPKYRKKKLFGQLRLDVREILLAVESFYDICSIHDTPDLI